MTEPPGDASATEREKPDHGECADNSGPGDDLRDKDDPRGDGISDDLLALFRCPTDHAPLTRADVGLVEQVNHAIRSGELRNQLGEPVDEPIHDALVSENRQRLYPIHNGILTMIADEAIPLNQKSLESKASAEPPV